MTEYMVILQVLLVLGLLMTLMFAFKFHHERNEARFLAEHYNNERHWLLKNPQKQTIIYGHAATEKAIIDWFRKENYPATVLLIEEGHYRENLST